MIEYEEISSGFRFGRVKKEYWNRHIQKKVGALVSYLAEEHELEVEGIYLENYRSPEPIIVINGLLPLGEIRTKFGTSSTFEIKDNKIHSTNPWVTIEGVQNDI